MSFRGLFFFAAIRLTFPVMYMASKGAGGSDEWN